MVIIFLQREENFVAPSSSLLMTPSFELEFLVELELDLDEEAIDHLTSPTQQLDLLVVKKTCVSPSF
jgi:hypothetical protein